MTYNTDTRRQYIEDRLTTSWGWVWEPGERQLLKGSNARSMRDMVVAIQKYFKMATPVSPATVKRDIDWIAKKWGQPTKEERSEAEALLDIPRFPEWRALLFNDPSNRGPILTPPHQLAWFHVMIAAALKVAIPEWVIEFLELPDDANEYIDDPEKMASFVLLGPPRHGKTMLVIHTIIWLICRNPDIRIIYSNGPAKITKQQINLLLQMLEHNEKLVAMYGPFKTDDLTWSGSEGFIVATRKTIMSSLTVRGVGKGGGILSLDADVIFVDDPQQPKEAMSEAHTEADYQWLGPGVMTRREPHTGFVGLGSHQPSPTGDVWSWLEDKAEEINNRYHRMIIKKVKAHDYELCPSDPEAPHIECMLWHDRRPYWWLESMRALLGDDVLFEAVYNQVPRSANMEYFAKEFVRGEYVPGVVVDKVQQPPETPGGILDRSRSWLEPVHCCGLRSPVTMGFDPGASERKTAAFSAAAVLAVCPRCQRRYLADYWQERVSPEHHPDILNRIFAAHPQLERCRIEDNAYQKSLARNKVLSGYAAKHRVVIEEWTTDERKADPRLGIPMMARHMRAGMYSVPYKTDGDRLMAEPVLKTLLRWPKRPNDLVMALWLADISAADILLEWTSLTPETMPGHHRSQWHEENDVEVDLSLVGVGAEYLALP